MRYKQVYDGEWVKPKMKGYLMKCCDCGLVHRINFKVVGKHILFQAFRKEKPIKKGNKK